MITAIINFFYTVFRSVIDNFNSFFTFKEATYLWFGAMIWGMFFAFIGSIFAVTFFSSLCGCYKLSDEKENKLKEMSINRRKSKQRILEEAVENYYALNGCESIMKRLMHQSGKNRAELQDEAMKVLEFVYGDSRQIGHLKKMNGRKADYLVL